MNTLYINMILLTTTVNSWRKHHLEGEKQNKKMKTIVLNMAF